MFTHLSIYLSISISLSLSIYISIYLSICIYIYNVLDDKGFDVVDWDREDHLVEAKRLTCLLPLMKN